jgi:hypothetical protein
MDERREQEPAEEQSRALDELWAVLREQRAHIEAQNRRMETLEAELEHQRVEKLSLASRVAEVEGGHGKGSKQLSRAGLLKAAAAGAAGVAALGALGRPDTASATVNAMYDGTNNNVDDATGIVIPLNGTYPADKDWIFWADGSRYSGHAVDGLRGTGAAGGNGVVGYGGSGGGAGIVGGGPGVTIPAYPLGSYGVAGYAGNNNAGVYGQGTNSTGVTGYATAGGSGVYGLAVGGGYGGQFSGDKAQLELLTNAGSIPPTLASGTYAAGDIWVGRGWNNAAAVVWFCTKGGSSGTWVPLMHGNSTDGTNDTLFTRVSTQQYSLSNSDGITWVNMDATNLSLTLTPQQDVLAVISGNSDLWTSQAGYNQDIGIMISGGAYPSHAGQPEAWKESGGFAGTYSPNAAFVQTVLQLVAGVAYTITLVWKANKSATGATIWAGAGPIGGRFSPTRLTAQLIPALPIA